MAWICCTPPSWSRAAELSPPEFAEPQVVIVLSPWYHKAKAPPVAASRGWSTRAVRHSPSSIFAAFKVLSGSTRTRFLAVISLRYFFPKACWAFVLRSWTVEEGKSVRSSAWPFGKATFTLSIELRRPVDDSSKNQEWISTSHFEPCTRWHQFLVQFSFSCRYLNHPTAKHFNIIFSNQKWWVFTLDQYVQSFWILSELCPYHPYSATCPHLSCQNSSGIMVTAFTPAACKACKVKLFSFSSCLVGEERPRKPNKDMYVICISVINYV